MPDARLHRFPTRAALAHAAAAQTVACLRQAPNEQPFSLVLSGGSTPRPYHEALATTFRDELPWGRIHLFWGDERYVPHDHPDSNYAMARETLIAHVPIPEANVHPIPTDAPTPAAAAAQYEETVAEFLNRTGQRGLDLVLLGMGDDGHTASLFPGTDALHETERLVTAVQAPPYAQPHDRITLTFPLLNHSRNVFFLVAGEQKQSIVADLLGPADTHEADHPAGRVSARNGVDWFVDEAAAARLS